MLGVQRWPKRYKSMLGAQRCVEYSGVLGVQRCAEGLRRCVVLFVVQDNVILWVAHTVMISVEQLMQTTLYPCTSPAVYF